YRTCGGSTHPPGRIRSPRPPRRTRRREGAPHRAAAWAAPTGRAAPLAWVAPTARAAPAARAAAAAPTTRPTRRAAARERAAAPTECRALRETGPRWAGRGAHPRRPPTRRSPRAARGSVRLRPYIYSALGEKS